MSSVSILWTFSHFSKEAPDLTYRSVSAALCFPPSRQWSISLSTSCQRLRGGKEGEENVWFINDLITSSADIQTYQIWTGWALMSAVFTCKTTTHRDETKYLSYFFYHTITGFHLGNQRCLVKMLNSAALSCVLQVTDEGEDQWVPAGWWWWRQLKGRASAAEASPPALHPENIHQLYFNKYTEAFYKSSHRCVTDVSQPVGETWTLLRKFDEWD